MKDDDHGHLTVTRHHSSLTYNVHKSVSTNEQRYMSLESKQPTDGFVYV